MSKGGRVTQLHKTEASAVKLDLETQLAAARKAQAEKLAQSEEHLVAQLKLASEKYLTVNGYMQARSVIDQVSFGDKEGAEEFPALACNLAREMSEIAGQLAEQVSKTDVMEISGALLDGLLVDNFVKTVPTLTTVVRQSLVVNLLQNIGPVIDDVVQFRESTNEAIATLQAELVKHTGVTEGQTTIDEALEETKQNEADARIKAANAEKE